MSLVKVKVLDLGGDPLKNAQVVATLKRTNPSKAIYQGSIVDSSDVNSQNYLANRAAGQITDKNGEVSLDLQPNSVYTVDSFYEFSVKYPFPVDPTDRVDQLWNVYAMVPEHDSNLELIATPIGLFPTLEQIRAAGFTVEDPTFENIVGLTNTTVGELVKSAATAIYDSGADTNKSIIKRSYGYIEAVAEGVTKRTFGLSSSGGDLDISGIDYGVELLDTGFFQPVEAGSLVGAPAAYVDGDTFKIEVDLDGAILIYKNGVDIGQTFTASTADGLRGVSAFATNGGKLTEIKIAADELVLNSAL